MRTGKLKERKVKLVIKGYDENYNKLPTEYVYAEAGVVVLWDGVSQAENTAFYGGQQVLWCKLGTGESLGLTKEEVDWDEDAD